MEQSPEYDQVWKPGDLALVTAEFKRGEITQEVAVKRADGWSRLSNDAYVRHGDVLDARRLVVIDPESFDVPSKIIGDLLEACANIVEREERGREVKEVALLRRLVELFDEVTDPKPVEPEQIGAVVEDRQGHRWTRIGDSSPFDIDSPPWRRRGHSARHWEHVSAVRVLSEGVSVQ